MITFSSVRRIGAAALAAATLSTGALAAGGEAIHYDRQSWTFAGFPLIGRGGYYDNNQLQRGFLVYKEVCSSCHGLKRIAFRNLVQPGGPEFPEAGVKALAATFKIVDGPNDQGKMFKRAGVLSDYIPSPHANEQEARSIHNGAYPPDLSIITKARGVEVDRPFWAVPFGILRDVLGGYQEGGADYVYALLTGYKDAPANVKLQDGMNYNTHFPGFQIAMVNPLSDGQVTYTDGTPATVANYAKDVTSFLAWAADPHLESRKRTGMIAIAYLLLTSLLLFLAKKRVWSRIPH